MSFKEIRTIMQPPKKYLDELIFNFNLGLKEKEKKIADYKNFSEDLDPNSFAFVFGIYSQRFQTT